MAKKVLITGGNGFIGRVLMRELLDSGYAVASFDAREPDPDLHEALGGSVEFVTGDITDPFSLARAASEVAPDYVVHMVAVIARLGDHDPLSSVRVNCGGILNVLELARAFPLEGVVYISSSAVFKGHPVDGGAVPNDAPLDPRNVYGASKAFSERLARHYWQLFGVKSVGLRLGVVHGPGRPNIVELIEKPAKGLPGKVPFGNESCEWIWVADAARAVRLAIENVKDGAGVYNIAGNYASVPDVVSVAREIFPDVEIEIDWTPRFEPYAAQLDWSAAQSELGYAPERDLKAMLRAAADAALAEESEGREA